MSDPVEMIREALRSYSETPMAETHAREALQALSEIESRVLPELPDGWALFELNTQCDTGYRCEIAKLDPDDQRLVGKDWIDGEGPTPRAAVLNALEKVK
jgi:hypothetical protein